MLFRSPYPAGRARESANVWSNQDQEDGTRQQCAGMWSKKSWGGDIDPFIVVKFKANPDSQGDEIVSLLIFEWEDGNYLGRLPSEDSEEVYIYLPTPYPHHHHVVIGS